MMSPNRLFWFEVEDGCFGCLLLCPESRMGEKPKCPLVQRSASKGRLHDG